MRMEQEIRRRRRKKEQEEEEEEEENSANKVEQVVFHVATIEAKLSMRALFPLLFLFCFVLPTSSPFFFFSNHQFNENKRVKKSQTTKR